MSWALDGPRVAAVVPVFNVERYLGQCIESLLAQTYPFSEIVLVDDGSTDSCGAICDEYAAAHREVTVVHKENAGLGFARNSGLGALSGESDYVMFVDSDDWLEPDAVEHLLVAAGGHPVDCVIGGHTKRTDKNDCLFELKLENERCEGEEIRNKLMPRLCGSAPSLSDSIPMSVCSSLYSANYIDRFGLRFPSEREIVSEDFVFKFNALLHAMRVVTCDFTGYNYRTNPGSLSMSYRADRFEATMHFYSVATQMIVDAKLPHEALVRMQKTLFIYLRKCISQELPVTSGKSGADAVAAIRRMLGDDRLRAVVRTYPVRELRPKQRTFALMLKYRMARLLYLGSKFGRV